jgi:hypothetical protein
VVEIVRNRQAGFLTNFETFLIKKIKYVNTSWRAAENWSEGRQLDNPDLKHSARGPPLAGCRCLSCIILHSQHISIEQTALIAWVG